MTLWKAHTHHDDLSRVSQNAVLVRGRLKPHLPETMLVCKPKVDTGRSDEALRGLVHTLQTLRRVTSSPES